MFKKKTRIYKTLIRKGGLGDIEFVLGKVCGIQYVLSHDIGMAIHENECGKIIEAVFTPKTYELFKQIVNRDYLGLCIFDYQE